MRNRRLFGVKFRRQYVIGPYIADFCCVEKQLVVELDGGQHGERTEADRRRTEFLAGQGYRVLRFWNNEVLKNTDSVLQEVARALGEVQPPSP